ncbi:hypothetical protein [Nocardia macrotermitis]|uniref:Uncharacterized protein n=1 Tax=Nocardia macrotermitis TaxID=2585198 RepID=A0A7K0D639_9NOCA|nr:hypothetical protein [Nocardia macrotermitis]MQY21197.1 hypothetical protein [Nocardia macrotermitis]
MYPSQPIAPEVPRYPSQQPGGAPRTMSRSPQSSGARSDALATFVTYAKALESLDRRKFPDEYAEHADRIKELEPFLKAHGILDVMQIKNPEVATLLGV